MCGISGFFDSVSTDSQQELEKLASCMGSTLGHRGPDDQGVWADKDDGVALCHQRLSIVDLSSAGHQPMASHNKRFQIVYNGEIFNANELREQLKLEGCSFRGHSDTEVLLEGCAVWGVEKTVKRLIGMFAFALWDVQLKQLTLVRDRLGIKPLYWGNFGSLLIFGSELKSLRLHPGWEPAIDPGALAAYTEYGYVPAPLTIYKEIFKLEPGMMLQYSSGCETELTQYWSLSDVAYRGNQELLSLTADEATVELESLLSDAVQRRMISDVPLGAFLSGGIDSSIVAALMQKNSTRPVRTFSIGFQEEGYNEAPYASAIAKYLGTDHTEIYVTANESRDVIPDLPCIYDEPFADASQIPTFLLSKLTREHVTVALSGDGGDELFAGYNRHVQSMNISALQQRFPEWMLSAAFKMIKTLSPDTLDKVFKWSATPQIGEKLHKVASLINANPDDFYSILVKNWNAEEILINKPNHVRLNAEKKTEFDNNFSSLVSRMQLQDGLTYLPDDILTKVDRASMAASLEVRVPILDHRVVEFAWRLPEDLKIRGGQGKWILRNLLYNHVPKKMFERPKAGFAVPIGDWLRGPLKEWGEELLNPVRLEREGFFEPDVVWRSWKNHQSGKQNNQYRLWIILMFQAWLEVWGKGLVKSL